MDFTDLDRDDFAAAIGDDRPRIDWSHAYRGDTVESRFEIRNHEDAEWTLAELLRWRDDLEATDARAKTYAARVRAWKSKRRQQAAVIVAHLEQLLTEYGRKVREVSGGQVTHIDVPSGRIQTTERRGTWQPTNLEVLLKWVDQNCDPATVDRVVTRAVDVDALRDYVEVQEVVIPADEPDAEPIVTHRIYTELIDENGDTKQVDLDGVEWVDPEVTVSARRVDWTA